MKSNIWATIKNELDIPIAEHHFNEPVVPPFAVYFIKDSDNFMADDKVYQRINNYVLELYSDTQGSETEELLEELLEESDVSWNKDVVFIEKEMMFQTAYTFGIQKGKKYGNKQS